MQTIVFIDDFYIRTLKPSNNCTVGCQLNKHTTPVSTMGKVTSPVDWMTVSLLSLCFILQSFICIWKNVLQNICGVKYSSFNKENIWQHWFYTWTAMLSIFSRCLQEESVSWCVVQLNLWRTHQLDTVLVCVCFLDNNMPQFSFHWIFIPREHPEIFYLVAIVYVRHRVFKDGNIFLYVVFSYLFCCGIHSFD